jgi:hypothetical protein
MKNYKVKIPVIIYIDVEVEAENGYDAVIAVHKAIRDETIFGKSESIVHNANNLLLNRADLDNLEITELV